MTAENKPADTSKADEKPIRIAPDAARPAPIDSDRRKAAKKAHNEYVKQFPSDDREFDQVKHLPNGPLEIADQDAIHEGHRQEKMRRFHEASNAKDKD